MIIYAIGARSMKKLMRYIFIFVAFSFLVACANKENEPLEEIAGVWRAKGDGAMVSIIYSDKKLGMLIGDNAIPISVGDIDSENKIINLNVTLSDGKLGIWTLKQVWDKDQKSFHLFFTLHDGTQDELTFVRKVSTDDLNKLANAEERNKPVSINNTAVSATAIKTPPPTTAQEAVAVPVKNAVSNPSFDCDKASTLVERSICDNPLLGRLDYALSDNYKHMIASNIGDGARSDLKITQKKWIAERNNCTGSDCLVDAYRKRMDEICEYPVLSGVHPSCTSSDEIE